MRPADVRPYRDALGDRICSLCGDRESCGRTGELRCGLGRHVGALVAAVLEVGQSTDVTLYLDALRRHVCPNCRADAAGDCVLRDDGRCNLDACIVPVIEVIEDVARRRGDGAWAVSRA